MIFYQVVFSFAVLQDQREADNLGAVGRLAGDKAVDFDCRACRVGSGADRLPDRARL